MGRIYRVAVVEDETDCLNQLTNALAMYSESHDKRLSIETFRSAESFLEAHKTVCFDIVFMDIELNGKNGMNGMDAAKKLRETDSVATLIFVTRMVQFAVEGYNVSAMDYIVKPVIYKNFVSKLDRAFSSMDKQNDSFITIDGTQSFHLRCSDIVYVEVQRHHLTFHLVDDKNIHKWGALRKITEELKNHGFALCSSSFLVNFRYVFSVSQSVVQLFGGIELPVTRSKKQEFMASLAEYYGKGGRS